MVSHRVIHPNPEGYHLPYLAFFKNFEWGWS